MASSTATVAASAPSLARKASSVNMAAAAAAAAAGNGSGTPPATTTNAQTAQAQVQVQVQTAGGGGGYTGQTAISANMHPSTSSANLYRLSSVQPASYNGQGSIQTMNEIYEVGEVIGTGTFGIIRKVIRKSDGLILARKELDYGRMDERDLKQLSEEVNILQNLEPNENIVRYYERYVDRQKFRLHIIMEFCQNGDLAAQIQRCRRKNTLLHEDTVWSYVAQIACALSDCHAELDKHGRSKTVILHRDIKPENVFLDRDNTIKLGDFGLSKAMASAAFTNTYVGTPYYMSPELINGQAYDQKSDIWALGCLIFELCAWHPPFHEARTQAELTKLIRDGRIPALPGRYSQNLQNLVKKMLMQDPKQRPGVEAIKAMDEVKMQMRVVELRKMHEEYKSRMTAVLSRETAVSERERLVSLRERDLEAERAEMHSERIRLAQIFSTFANYQAAAASSSGSGSTSTSTSTAPSSRDNSPVMDQKENLNMHLVPGSQGHTFPHNDAEVPTSKTLARVASRPSLVPRRPLEERRASTISINTHQLTKRYSCQSLQAMAVDGETPTKSAVVTPSTNDSRRRIAASKSMHNLKSSGGSRMDSPTARMPPSSLAGSRQQPQSAGPTMHSFNPQQLRPSSASVTGEITSVAARRSDSAASMATLVSSPGKRPQPMSRTATAPPQLTTAQSTSSIVSLAAHHSAGVPSITTSAAPRWNLDDEDSLPSPFIKKKISMGPLRAIAAQQAATISGGSSGVVTRRQSTTNLAAAAGGSVNSTNRLRPSTTRQSLANRLASVRQSNKVDEQGRRLTSTTSS